MRRVTQHKKALQTIKNLYDDNSEVFIMHYSSEDIYNTPNGQTPRATSIAIRHLKTGQTHSFSIHKVAEIKGIKVEQIDTHYDELEKEMLKEFFESVLTHKNYKWIMWKMRDINIGFQALEHRYRILGGKPTVIEDDKKFQLSRLLKDIYGMRYITKPRMYALFEKNEIRKKHLLKGDVEAKCFENKDYVKMHKSTLSKVEALETIIMYTADKTLKTNSTLKDKYGSIPQELFELSKENWKISLIFSIIGILIGILLTKLFY